jgi:hypothetical protein
MVNVSIVVGRVEAVIPGEKADLLIVADNSSPQYPQKIACEFYGKNKGALSGVGNGELVKVMGSSKSREYQGKWYTSFSAFSIARMGNGQGPAPTPDPGMPF